MKVNCTWKKNKEPYTKIVSSTCEGSSCFFSSWIALFYTIHTLLTSTCGKYPCSANPYIYGVIQNHIPDWWVPHKMTVPVSPLHEYTHIKRLYIASVYKVHTPWEKYPCSANPYMWYYTEPYTPVVSSTCEQSSCLISSWIHPNWEAIQSLSLYSPYTANHITGTMINMNSIAYWTANPGL